MKKRILGLTLVAVLILTGTAVYASDPIKILVNGVEVKGDVPAQIINGRTMTPARLVAEALGAQVDWDGATRTVIIQSPKAPDAASKEWEQDWSKILFYDVVGNSYKNMAYMLFLLENDLNLMIQKVENRSTISNVVAINENLWDKQLETGKSLAVSAGIDKNTVNDIDSIEKDYKSVVNQYRLTYQQAVIYVSSGSSQDFYKFADTAKSLAQNSYNLKMQLLDYGDEFHKQKIDVLLKYPPGSFK